MSFPTNYGDCARLIEKARDREAGKPIANNTRVMERWRPVNSSKMSKPCATRARCYAVKFHATDVVTFFPDGWIELDSGGWRTVSTRDRMNRALGGLGGRWSNSRHVFSERNHMGVRTEQGTFEFEDGMVITAIGTCSTREWSEVEVEILEEMRAQRRRSREQRREAFVNGFLNRTSTWAYGVPARVETLSRVVIGNPTFSDAIDSAPHVMYANEDVPLAVILPRVDERFHHSLLLLNRERRHNVIEDLAELGLQRGYRVTSAGEDELRQTTGLVERAAAAA